MTAGLEQRRRNVRVLDLLTESYMAHSRGDRAAAAAKQDEALSPGGQACVVIAGGMLIGEVPNPDHDLTGWSEYVEAQREALAALEAGEATS